MQNGSGLTDELTSLRLNKRLYDQASRLAGSGGWECDLATEHLTWTDGVYHLFGLPVGSPLRRASIVDLYADESRSEMEFMRAEAIRSGQRFVIEAQIRTLRGESRWMRLSADVSVEDGRPVRLFGGKQDITHEREAWDRLRQQAERDPLTGLGNRSLFEARYRDITGSDRAASSISALVLIDVDHFKQINDRFGHAAGDECLRQVAKRLQGVFREAVLVARIGGDEFAVLLRAPLGPARIDHMLRRATGMLSKPVLWNATRIDIGVSIGARILRDPPAPAKSDLFADADAALYGAKAAGRNTVRIFGAVIPETSLPGLESRVA